MSNVAVFNEAGLDLQQSLLPVASSREEHATDLVGKKKLDFDFSNVDTNPKTCDAKLLPWLACQWRVSITGLTEKEQRSLISNAREIHQYKGTVYAVKVALSSVFESSTITEFSGERVFEFDAQIQLKADTTVYYDAAKFDTARNLINTAKNGRSRFINFDIQMPYAVSPIAVQAGAALNLGFSNQLSLNAQSSIAFQTAFKWDLQMGESNE